MNKPRVRYIANRQGFRDMGLSEVATEATAMAAKNLAANANTRDPNGRYTYHGVGTYVGRGNDPRNAAVVEGQWYPGAYTAALKNAVADLAKQNRSNYG